MLSKLRALFSLYRRFGLGWFLFRLEYVLRMRLGILCWQMPAYEWDERPLSYWLKSDVPSEPADYVRWREGHAPKFFFDGIPSLPRDLPWNPQIAVDEAEHVLEGELRYFEHTPYQIGFPPDWYLDPRAQVHIDSRKHWSQIPDYGEYDIKFAWEASRFNQVYALVRAYAKHPDERYPEAFWTLVEDWAQKNPPQRGPNWKCGQETSLRLLAWCFGLYGFKRSPSSTPGRVAQLTQMIAAQADRVYGNIDYAISTRGNHAVSEAFGSWLAGTLFPELKQAETYRAAGRRLLEREAEIHIFRDGTYSMYSLNYHRFILHIYFLAMRLGELNHDRFSESLYRSIASSLDFMHQLIEPSSGEMPVYGSNDGALVCPLDTCDFTDYRPTLQTGWFLVHGKRLFEAGAWDETLFWLNGEQALRSGKDAEPRQVSRSFPDGGVHILRGLQSFALIRCTDFRERPSHADQLHVDLWWRGQNIACDAGTFLYNGQGIWQNGLAHTAVHNTVSVDGADQMLWFSRFTWGEWARSRVTQKSERRWWGEHDGYLRLPDPVTHKRTVLMLDEDRWLVVDYLFGRRPHRYSLHWLINDFPHSVTPNQNLICLWPESDKLQICMGLLEGESVFSTVRSDPHSTRGWRSRYYGQKEPALSAMLETERANACFWTFFGFEGDSVTPSGHVLDLQLGRRLVKVSLADPSALLK
jgi:hypothetical protein